MQQNRTHNISPAATGLFTDLYELTMARAYFQESMRERAVFSLFVRRLPSNRNYLVTCGLEAVLDHLETLSFAEEDIRYLESLNRFSAQFLEWLQAFRFSGDVRAMPEGTPFFANEPIMEIEAPLPEAQIAETFIMNQIHVQTLFASKAARVVTAAAGRPVFDFGARRMHGIDAALKAARAFHIGGVTATSNVLAGKLYGIPLSGTMAHSYIQAHENESLAFERFCEIYPDTVLLVDTYDTLNGVRRVIDLVKRRALEVGAVRLDSGDLAGLARETRRLLDKAGLDDIKILVSGGLDEDAIAEMISDGAPIDGFGVGTSMGVSRDAPDLDIAYKLCEYAGTGRLKLSAGKPVLPGQKQIFRAEENGVDAGDIIARADEDLKGRPLLKPFMKNGARLQEAETDINRVREQAEEQIARLPARLRGLDPADPPYPVSISDALSDYQQKITGKLHNEAGGKP